MISDDGVTASRAEEIRRRAYHIWERDGRPHGRHDDHWTEAEQDKGGADKGGYSVPDGASRDAAVAPKEPQLPGSGPDPLVTTPM